MADSSDLHPLVEDFLFEYRNQKQAGTLGGYKAAAQQFVDHIDCDPSEVRDREVKRYLNWLLDRYPESTTKTRYYNLRSFLHFLVDEGVLDELPGDDISISDYVDRGYTQQGAELKSKEGVIYLEDEEIKQLLRHVPEPRTRNELMLKLMLQCGLRASEVVRINRADIDHDERRIQITTSKTGKIRDVWYQPSLQPLLNRWINADRDAMPTSEDSDRLFISRYSPEMSPNRPNRVVKTAAENAGIQSTVFTDAAGGERDRITSHSLRHTFAVNFIRSNPENNSSGGDVRTLQLLLGHTQISTTEKYLRFADETLRSKMQQHGLDV